jgi:hypothetical protein
MKLSSAFDGAERGAGELVTQHYYATQLMKRPRLLGTPTTTTCWAPTPLRTCSSQNGGGTQGCRRGS